MHDMQTPPPSLLPLLRSAFQGELLAWLYLHPDEQYTASELAHRFGVSQATASRESDRLVEAGLVRDSRRGRLRLLQANTDSIIAEPLTALLAFTFGPIAVVPEALATIDGVHDAYIYGSWAARYSGKPGPAPNDVDLLVVGEADEDELFSAARSLERRLGREVNLRQVSLQTWLDRADDTFLNSLQSAPLIKLDLTVGS